MSGIIITVENFKRNAKRLQKALKASGLDVNLTQSQDLMAKSFGVKNTFEMLALLDQESPQVSVIDTKNEQDIFVNELESILKSSSLIKKAFLYTDYGNFILDICSKSEESYGIYFGATNNPSIKDFTVLGIDDETSERLVNLSKMIPSDKYEGLLFGSNLFKKYCKNKNVYYFKNELFKDELMIDGKLYHKRHTKFKRWKVKESLLERKNELGFYLMKGHNYAGKPMSSYSDTEDIVVEYYHEMHCFNHNSTCYAAKFFEITSKGFKEILYEDI